MKRPSPLVQQGNQTDLDSAMTPMIDVVFLLLVFFVWTASFQMIEYVLPSEMSSQAGSAPVENPIEEPPKDFDDVVVRIDWDGQAPSYIINEQTVASLKEVQQRLTAISELEIVTPVILHPEPVVPLGVVIEVYDTAKLSGFAEVSFAINPQGL
ncbi:MAG: biopolymer transporter ExbD [Planctomycetota bacterium]